MLLGQFHHGAEGHIQQPLFGSGLSVQTFLGQHIGVTAGGNGSQFLQIKPQRIVFLQSRQQCALLSQLLFPAQPQGCITGSDDFWQIGNIQFDLPCFQLLERILQSLF